MKRTAIIRLLSIVIIFSLVLMVAPELPVYAANTVTLSPTSGKVGDSVTVYCTFTDSALDRFAKVYLSPSNLNTNVLMSTATSYMYMSGNDIPTDDDA